MAAPAPAPTPLPVARSTPGEPGAGPADSEKAVVPLEGEIVAVPVPPLTTDVVINVGSAHRVASGEYFLVHSATVRAAALLKVLSVQDRMSTVQVIAQLATLSQGDRVTRISAARAQALKRQFQFVNEEAPPLGSDILVDTEMRDAAGAALRGDVPPPGGDVPSPAGAMPAAPAPPVPGMTARPLPGTGAGAGPDLSDIMLMARGTAAGVALSWQAPSQGTMEYLIYRSETPDDFGVKMTPMPLTGLTYEDRNVRPGILYTYHLVGVVTPGGQSGRAPSIEVTYTPPSSVKARNIPEAVNPLAGRPGTPGAIAPPVLPAPRPLSPPVPGAPPVPPAPGVPPVPAAPPAPGIPPAPKSVAGVPAAPPPTAPAMPPLPGASMPPAPAPSAPPRPAPSAPPLPVPATPPLPGPATPPLPVPSTAPAPAAPAPPPPAAPAPAAPPAPATPDAGVPPAPEKVSLTLEGSTVVVKWNPVSSKVPLAGYLVFRAGSAEEQGAALNGSPTSDLQYRDRSAQEDRTYVYWVVAQTVEGKQGPASPKSSVTVPKSGGAVPFF